MARGIPRPRWLLDGDRQHVEEVTIGSLTDLPAEGVWAVIGAGFAGIGAYVNAKMVSKASPYDSLAARLVIVEKQAARVPFLESHLNILTSWSAEASAWMVDISKDYHEGMGEQYWPPAPLPPPIYERIAHDRDWSGFERRSPGPPDRWVGEDRREG